MAKRKSKTGVPEARKPDGDRATWLLEKMHEATFQYTGDLGRLEAALGFLMVGHYYGWKVLYLIHTKKTVRADEEILDISVREDFDELGLTTNVATAGILSGTFQTFGRWSVGR